MKSGSRLSATFLAKWFSRAVALGFLALLFYYPLAAIFARGLTPQSLVFLLEENAISLIWFTVWQALVSAIGSTLLGLVFAYLLYRKNFAGQQVLRALFTLPFVLPIITIAMAFNTFQISNVILAIILSHIYINAPLVARAVGSAWMQLDSSIDDAAELDGAGRLRSFLNVTVFQLRQVITGSFVLVFAYCATAFGTVLLLGSGQVNTIETAIYQRVFSYLDLPAAVALGLVQLLLTLLLFAATNRLASGNLSFGTSVGAASKKLDRRDLPISVMGCVVLLGWIAPIWNVFQIAFGVNADFGIEPNLLNAAINSMRNVVIVLAICSTLGLLVSYLIARDSSWSAQAISFAYLTPISISTVLVGLGFLVGFSSFRSSWLVIPLALSVLALPLVVRIVSAALSDIDADLIEQASIDGASAWQKFRLIELPLVSSSYKGALGFAAVIALGDFGASAFLSFGDQDTIPIVLYRLFSRPGAENYQQAMFLTALLLISAAALVLLTSLRMPKRTLP